MVRRPARDGWARCAGCGQVRPVRGGTLDAAAVRDLHPPRPGLLAHLPGLRTARPHRMPGAAPAARCEQRLRELLQRRRRADPPGAARPCTTPWPATERPDTVAELARTDSAAPAILRELAAGRPPLTHAALDELPASKTVEHLRSVLVATGDPAAPRRADGPAGTLDHRAPSPHAPTPTSGSCCTATPSGTCCAGCASRHRDADATHDQVVAVQQHIRAAIALLDWLTARGLTLATARQGDLEAWLAGDQATHRARRRELRPLGHAATSSTSAGLRRHPMGRARPASSTPRPAGSRPAGCCTTTPSSPTTASPGCSSCSTPNGPPPISRLTLDHIHTSGTTGAAPARPRARRPARTARRPGPRSSSPPAAATPPSATREPRPGCSPAASPAGPISAYRLGERLRQLGLHPGQARSTALFQLATDLPAALLARMLGIHISVAVAWQRASAGDWTAYAAEIGRRADSPRHG